MRYSGSALSLSRRLAQKKTTIEGLAPLLDVCRAAARLLVEKQPAGVDLGQFASRLDALTKRLESPLTFWVVGSDPPPELDAAIDALDVPARLETPAPRPAVDQTLVLRRAAGESLHKTAFVVGRDNAADVPLTASPHVSKRHLRFEPSSNGWMATDLGTTNGTWIASPLDAAPERVEPNVATPVARATRFILGGEPGLAGAVELVVEPRDQDKGVEPDVLVLCGLRPSLDALRLAERKPEMPILLCEGATIPDELALGRHIGEWGEDAEIWLQRAVAIGTQARNSRGLGDIQTLLQDVAANIASAVGALARQAEADRDLIKASKADGDKLKHLLDDAAKGLSEHHARLRDAVRSKTEGQLNRRIASSLAAKTAAELAKYEPNLAMPCDLDLGVVRFQCIGQVTGRITELLQQMTEEWGTSVWMSLADRRQAQVVRLYETIGKIPGAKADWVPSFEREREVGPKVVRRILAQPVVFSDTITLEHRNPIISILRSAQNTIMLLMMGMFLGARVGLLGRNEITLWLQQHDKQVMSLLVVLLVVAFISHFKGVAKTVRAAIQKDAEAILGYWISAIQDDLETRLEHHAKEVKAILDTRVARAVDSANSQAAEAVSAAQTRISETGSRIRQLEAYAEGLQVMVRTLPS